MSNTMVRLFNTVRYLKPVQVYYRIFYALRKKIGFSSSQKTSGVRTCEGLKLLTLVYNYTSYANGKFVFLNKEHFFGKEIKEIDWNFNDYGKLWTYNLTYFDFLHQENISKETGLQLIHDFINKIDTIQDGLEPFPISLRGINWIKFLSKYQLDDRKINESLYEQYQMLFNNLEYHLLGNHLLENAFALLYGAYYFKEEAFYRKARKLLVDELKEQVLNDGAHFELSPMYHQIMLLRILECINLLQHNQWKKDELLPYLIVKAELMLGWLDNMTFNNGDIPLFNDSTNKIAPTTDELKKYASELGIVKKENALSDSGYRKFVTDSYELIVDVGNIGPDYIPGHAHSDTFNFELYIKGVPVIVDTGLSTYETNVRRTLERSTQSHNTVMVNETNQSEVWGGFRVAKRAKIIDIKDGKNFVEATHDGYKNIGILHTRKFLTSEDKIVIEDIVSTEDIKAIAYIHLHPDIKPVVDGAVVHIDDIIITMNSDAIEIKEYMYAPEFNKLIPAKVIEIKFSKNLKMELTL